MNVSRATAEAQLLAALGAAAGLVCLVGAGGKKTTLYRLARAHTGRVAVTATVHIPPVDRRVIDSVVVCGRNILLPSDGGPSVLTRVRPDAGRRIAFVGALDKSARHHGIAPEDVDAIAASGSFDLCLVKADGARSRLVKAPADYEPVLPAGLTTLIACTAIRAVGEPLDDRIAHRPERIAGLLGVAPGSAITPEQVGRLLAAAYGAVQVPGPHARIALINMVDDDACLRDARVAAATLLESTDAFDRVVLAAMGGAGLVEVIR